MINHRSSYRAALTICAMLLLAPQSTRAVTMQLEFTPFAGDSSSILLSLSDDGGIITGDVSVVANPNIGDLRALFIQINDDSILSQLEITGSLITDIEIDANGVTSIGNANVEGDGSPGPFDIGIAFGSPGTGSDDIQSASFIISHESTDLSLEMFDLSNWAARLTSVGPAGGPREASSKLAVTLIRPTGLTPPQDFPLPPPLTPQGDPNPPGLPSTGALAPIPEPGTAALIVVAGALGANWWRRRRREA